MKKILLTLLNASFLLFSLNLFSGNVPAPSTTKGRSNVERNAHHIVGGWGFSVEIRNGEIWSWGKNSDGELGNGTYSDSNIPVREATNASDWVDINTGSTHVIALKSDGTIWAWGLNDFGQLGIPSVTGSSNVPQQIGSANDWVSIGCGTKQTYVIKANGSLWSCGANTSGALGINSSQNENLLTMVGNNTNWRIVSGGNNHVAAIQMNGTLWTWGSNSSGQLGNSLQTSQELSPIQIGSSTNWISVETGDDDVMALQNNGRLYAWGNNQSGQLGNGNTTNQSVPVQIGGTNFWVGMASGQTGNSSNVTQTLAVTADGKVFSWGNNEYGQLGNTGNHDSSPHSTPTQVSTLTNIINVECGYGSSYALAADGKLYTWGYNNKGQLGNGNNTDIYSPIHVSIEPLGWSKVTGGDIFTAALKSDGTLWAWGDNGFGQLGNGIAMNSTPIQMQVSGSNFTRFACGQSHCLAIKANGTLWAWGNNTAGQLGIGSVDNSEHDTPINIGVGSAWIAVSCGDNYSMAIQANGTLWAWGNNSFGQLGNGNSGGTPNTTPIQIGSLDSWVDVECGANFTLAIKADGTLWSWGNNNSGQLGLGSTSTEFTSPQQVTAVAANNWISVAAAGGGAHALGVTSNGVIYSWGDNSHRQLGDGTTNSHNSPIPISYFSTSGIKGLTVYCGSYHSFAIVNNGDIYAWGENANGQLGLGDNTFRSTPTHVTSQSNIIGMGCGFNHSCVIHVDRLLLCVTGLNNFGQIGNGTTINTNTFQCIAITPCSAPTAPIISSPTPAICGAGTVTLNIVGGALNDDTSWQWYTNSCGGTPIGSGTSISVSPSTTTAYYARAEGGCVAAGPCSNISITVNLVPSISITGTGSVCAGSSTTLSASGGSSYSWSNGETTSTIIVSPSTSTSYSVTGTNATSGCTSTASQTVTVNALPSVSTSSPTLAVCEGWPAILYGLGANSYSWSGGISDGIAFYPSSSSTYTLTGTDANGCSNTATSVVTVNTSPIISCPSDQTASTASGSTTIFYTASYSGTPAPSISYSLSGATTGGGIGTGSGSSFNVGTTTVTLTATNSCGTATCSFNVVITSSGGGGCTSAPVSPIIGGPNAVCGMSTGVYTATSASAVSYTWTVPTGISITSGQGTSSIHTSYLAGTINGNITASATNACGTSAVTSYLITKKPQTPSAISGPTSLCGLTTANYSATSFGATSYNWTLPAGITITSGTGTSSINVAISSNFTAGNISVIAVNACGSLAGTAITVVGSVPAVSTSIAGLLSVCGLSTITYTATGIPGASSYSWTLPAGFSQLTASGNSITLLNSGFTVGSISVRGVNGCGIGAVKSLALTSATATPGLITGPTVTCGVSSAAYSVAPVSGAISYSWTLPLGATVSFGQGTNSIVATFTNPMVGNVSVSAFNGCTYSALRSLAVNKTPAATTAITGSLIVCPLSSYTYSVSPVAGATSYLWVLPSGVTFATGQGTSTITVVISSPSFVSGQLRVYAQNACGNSAYKAITLSACAAPNSLDDKTSFSIYPNPAYTTFTLMVDDEQVSSSNLKCEVYDVLGNCVINTTLNNTTSTINIETLNKGLYFVRLIDAEGRVVYTEKLVVSH